MDKTNHVSRYRIAPYPDPEMPWAIFDHDNPSEETALKAIELPIDGCPTRRQCEVALERMDLKDMVGIETEQRTKQAVTAWISQVTARYGFQPDEIMIDVWWGIKKALDYTRQVYQDELPSL